MNRYSDLTVEQLNSFYKLLDFLKRLRIIGDLEIMTSKIYVNPPHNVFSECSDMRDLNFNGYTVSKIGYERSRDAIEAQEVLEKLFGRLSSKFTLNTP